MSLRTATSVSHTSRAPLRRPQFAGARVLLLAALALGVAACTDASSAQNPAGQSQASQTGNQTTPQQGSEPGQQESGPGMMGGGQMMGPGGGGGMMGGGRGGMMGGGRGGMMGNAPNQHTDQQAARRRGIVGLFLELNADTVGAPARLIVRRTVPYAPASSAGIESGDQIVAVDGRPVNGKKLRDVATAIDGEVGTTVKLSVRHDGKPREVTLTRVAPVRSMSRDGRMGGGMMDMMNMMNMMSGDGGMMDMMAD